MTAAKRKTVAPAPTAENGNAGPGSTRFPYIVNLLLLVITLVLNLTIQEDPRYWNRFRDVKDYLQQSQQPLLSSDFFMPRYINSRPFTVPLFYKAAGSNPHNIVFMQVILHSLSTCFIAYALLLFIRNEAGKYLMMFLIYSLMSWWCILGWTLQLLSESLTVSLLFCWIASFLLFYKKRRPAFLIFHLLIAILLSNTRDSWPFTLMVFYLLISLKSYLWERKFLRPSLLFLSLSMVLLLYQQYTARIGLRFRLPVANSIIIRVLPDEKYTEWFENHGMPMTGYLENNFRDLNADTITDIIRIHRFYHDETHDAFFQWTGNEGRLAYMKFMLTHPAYSFLLREPVHKLKRMLFHKCHNYFYYPKKPQGYSTWSGFIYPLFHPLWIPVFCLFLIAFYAKTKEHIYLFPVILSITFLFNALLLYNADAMEVERHMMLNNIMIQFLCIWSSLLILDYFTIGGKTQTFIKILNIEGQAN